MNNAVELVGHYGGDLEHALSAWTSTSRELTEEKSARIPALLTQLAGAGHETPFEKSALHFLVTTDIATHIHLIKHRVGVSVNAESARYKELREDKFYVPDDWPEHLREKLSAHVQASQELYHQLVGMLSDHLTDEWSKRVYNTKIPSGMEALRQTELAARKRAKESARFVLPYATQITADVQFNFRSFMHFAKLRADAHAQREVRALAYRMLWQAHNIAGRPFRHSLDAFGWDIRRVVTEAKDAGVTTLLEE